MRVLYSPGCANWPRAMEEARAAMEAAGVPGEPEAVLVRGYVDGKQSGFRGSPTVTVDGADVEPEPPGEPGLAFG